MDNILYQFFLRVIIYLLNKLLFQNYYSQVPMKKKKLLFKN